MSGWEAPSEHLRRYYDGEPDPEALIPPEAYMLRTDAPADSEPFRALVAQSVEQMTEWINEQIEAGATDALVGALRDKGYSVIEPADRTRLLAETRDAEDWARYPARRTAELIYRIRRALEGKR